MLNDQLSRAKKLLFVMFLDFHGVNNPPMTNFKYQLTALNTEIVRDTSIQLS